jgi:predicted GNAT superfamily acetyltransferase
MNPARRDKKKRDDLKIRIAPFCDLSDYNSCVEIQQEVWRFSDLDVTPVSLLLAIDHSGGITLGAYNTLDEMIGFVSSFPGIEKGKLFQHSHQLAVRTAYRNFNVGYRLKLAQRKEALKRKIGLIEWTFDPMQPLNAYFNLAKLGARAEAYEKDFYGESTSPLHRGLPTDRFMTRWDLTDGRVVRRLEDGPPLRDLRRELRRYPLINELQGVESGITISSPVKLSCTEPELLFEIPYNLPEIRARNLVVALEWQGKMRQVFRSYFRRGYAVSDFWVAEDEGHLRAFYFLENKGKT